MQRELHGVAPEEYITKNLGAKILKYKNFSMPVFRNNNFRNIYLVEINNRYHVFIIYGISPNSATLVNASSTLLDSKGTDEGEEDALIALGVYASVLKSVQDAGFVPAELSAKE